MLATVALQELTDRLNLAIASMGIRAGEMGKPELVQKAAREAERFFQGYAKAQPTVADAYSAALAFMRGETLTGRQRDLIASAISLPIREQSGRMVLGCKRFGALLASYEEEAARGELWRLTWHGLLYSYFSLDPDRTSDQDARKGWEALRSFLERTWPLIDRQADNDFVPDWISVMRSESGVLGTKPADKYAWEYLQGDNAATDKLAADLGIPSSSWFWHSLVLCAVQRAAADNDANFQRHIPRLISLIESKPGFRDEAIEIILTRYHSCKGAPQSDQLREFVCQPDVWKNPKLKLAGIATAWTRVSDPVWQMVLSWVNKRTLKDFFDILVARNRADEGRLAFWSRYMEKIEWTKLVFGADTMALKRTNAEVRNLIAREENAYAELTGRRDVDAFMMRLDNYLIIEFSKKPNACYVYEIDKLPFEPHGKHYDGGTTDLAEGFYGERAVRIVHTPGWEARAHEELAAIGIVPDSPRSGATWTSKPDVDALAVFTGSDMTALKNLVARFGDAFIDDKRSGSHSGRLWVEDPLQRAKLSSELEALGFKWANKRRAWYYPET